MGSKRKTKSNKKDPAKKLRVVKPPDYVLVIYSSDNTVGVVSRDTLKPLGQEGIVRGAECSAPLPLEMNSCDINHLAKIVEIGHDPDFLYSLIVDTEGNIIPESLPDTVLAPKKSKCLGDKEKYEQLRKVDSNLESLTPLGTTLFNAANETAETPDKEAPSDTPNVGGTTDETSGHGPGPSTRVSQGNQLRKVDSNLESLTPLGTTLFNAANETAETPDKEAPSDTPNVGGTTDNISGHGPGPSTRVSQGNMEASNFFQSLIGNMHCPKPSCPFIEVVRQATPENLSFLNNLYAAILEHKHDESASPQTHPSDNPQTETETQRNLEEPINLFKDLDCFQAGTEENPKYPLVQTIDVYMTKIEILSLPSVVVQTEEEKGRKKPREKGKLYARGMVTYLLEKLIPQEILKKVTISDIPQPILCAIKCHINFKLPEGHKVFDGSIRTWVTDHLRGLNRKRMQEPSRQMQLAKCYVPGLLRRPQ